MAVPRASKRPQLRKIPLTMVRSSIGFKDDYLVKDFWRPWVVSMLPLLVSTILAPPNAWHWHLIPPRPPTENPGTLRRGAGELTSSK